MSTLSYLHQLFNIDQCQTYIHTLRWKDRALQCPRCQSQDIDPWGTYHYRPGCKRYWCNGCRIFACLAGACWRNQSSNRAATPWGNRSVTYTTWKVSRDRVNKRRPLRWQQQLQNVFTFAATCQQRGDQA